MITKITTALAVTGIVLGGVGIGFVGQRVFSDNASQNGKAGRASQTVQTYRCPDQGKVGVLTSGDRVFITGQDARNDPKWLEIRNPADTSGRLWVQADGLQADATTKSLPVVTCTHPIAGKQTATGSRSTRPNTSTTTSSTTVPGATTTTKPGQTTIPGATTIPDHSGTIPGHTTTVPGQVTTPPQGAPSIDKFIANPTTITENRPDTCPGESYSTTVTVNASNTANATLHWNMPGNFSGTRPMSRNGTTFTAQLGPFGPFASDDDGTITVWVTASGPGGTTSSNHFGVTFKDCAFFG